MPHDHWSDSVYHISLLSRYYFPPQYTTMSGPKRVMFLHGLESGPTGSKARKLQSHLKHVLVPDLYMSVFDWNKKNSAIRNWMSLSRSMELCVGEAVGAIRAEFGEGAEGDGRIRSELIIVGSSWGGALGLKLLSLHNIHPYKTVLLAPALSVTGGFKAWFWPAWQPASLPNDGTDVIVYHGDADETVPVEGSRVLKSTFPKVTYHELPGGDHRLKDALLKPTEECPNGVLLKALEALGATLKDCADY